MTTLRQLKEKWSGQTIPDWELEAAGLKQPAAPHVEAEPPKRRGRPPKAESGEAEPKGE